MTDKLTLVYSFKYEFTKKGVQKKEPKNSGPVLSKSVMLKLADK